MFDGSDILGDDEALKRFDDEAPSLESPVLRNLSAWHIVILVAVLVLLFGANKLPELARGVGQSLRIFKSEVKDLTADEPAPAQPAAPAPATTTLGSVPEQRPAA